jgi:hypothetical protein
VRNHPRSGIESTALLGGDDEFPPAAETVLNVFMTEKEVPTNTWVQKFGVRGSISTPLILNSLLFVFYLDSSHPQNKERSSARCI